MEAVLAGLKALKLWQIGVLAAVLVGAGGAVYGVYALASGSGTAALTEDQQLIPVQYGNLVNQVSTNGRLIFATRELLTFGSQGTVGEVLVEEGQPVQEGELLARLDADSVASLEKLVAQARVTERNAEDDLAEAQVPYEPADVAKAQSQVDLAKTSVSNAEKDLKLVTKDWDAKIGTAQDGLATAAEGYRAVYLKWLGISLGETELGLSPDALLASWGVDLGAFFVRSSLWVGLPSDDPATPWNEFVLYAWSNLYPGRISTTCESSSVPRQGACVNKEMDDAWDVYQKALDNMDTVETQAAKAISSTESTVTRAVDTVTAAEQTLVDQQAGSDLLVVALREAEVTSAGAALETAIQRLEGATIEAPMAGVVSFVNVVDGQTVNANTPIVEVVDPTVVELDGIVDEIDVLFVRVGAKADVTMDALPGQVLEATVSSIASAAQSQQGVVSYPLRILLQVPEGVELREGLSATAAIVIREENNVLLVPLQALHGTFQQPVVRVVGDDGRVIERPVVLGNSDDYWVAVHQGLAEGDRVVMQAQAATAGQFGFGGGGFRQLQGQLRGVGGGGGGQQQPQATPQPRNR